MQHEGIRKIGLALQGHDSLIPHVTFVIFYLMLCKMCQLCDGRIPVQNLNFEKVLIPKPIKSPQILNIAMDAKRKIERTDHPGN